MASDTIELLLAQVGSEGWLPSAIDMIVREHMGYGRFSPDEFRAFLTAVSDEARIWSAKDWCESTDRSWRMAIAGLMRTIEQTFDRVAPLERAVPQE